MIEVRSPHSYVFLLLTAAGCTGLVAGPESRSATPVPVSRDSAYVRARRALQGETFTIDAADSSRGHLVASRWPGSNAKLGTSTACHVLVDFQIEGDDSRSDVTYTSRWVAPGSMSDKAAQVCEQERSQVLNRTMQVIDPPATP